MRGWSAGRRESPRGCLRPAFTFPELATVVAVVVCLLAVVAPYLLTLWETSRQQTCADHLKTLGLAVTRYQDEAKRFPAGQSALKFKNDDIGRYADPDEPRAAGGEAASGASWVVTILGQLGRQDLQQQWRPRESVAANAGAGQTDLSVLYCPSRRGSMSAGSYPGCERLLDSWRAGGSDYAGCSGSGISFNDVARQTYALTTPQVDATMRGGESAMSGAPTRLGIFGVNSRVTKANVADADGLSWVILISERRLTGVSTPNELRSSDGWAWGGPATLMTTRYGPHSGRHYSEADSEHPNLVQICMADAVVRKVNWAIDLRTWNNLGSYADGSPITHPAFRR